MFLKKKRALQDQLILTYHTHPKKNDFFFWGYVFFEAMTWIQIKHYFHLRKHLLGPGDLYIYVGTIRRVLPATGQVGFTGNRPISPPQKYEESVRKSRNVGLHDQNLCALGVERSG